MNASLNIRWFLEISSYTGFGNLIYLLLLNLGGVVVGYANAELEVLVSILGLD